MYPVGRTTRLTEACLETCEDLANRNWILLLLVVIDGAELGGLSWLNVAVECAELDDLLELSRAGFESW